MILEIAPLTERATAIVAFVGLVAAMKSLVNLQEDRKLDDCDIEILIKELSVCLIPDTGKTE